MLLTWNNFWLFEILQVSSVVQPLKYYFFTIIIYTVGKKTYIWALGNLPLGLQSSDFRFPTSDFWLPTSDFRLLRWPSPIATKEVGSWTLPSRRAPNSEFGDCHLFGDCHRFGARHWFKALHRFKACHRSIKFCTFQLQFWERLIRISNLGNHPRKILFWQKGWQLVPNLPVFNFVLIYKILHLPVPILGKTHKNKYPWEPS